VALRPTTAADEGASSSSTGSIRVLVADADPSTRMGVRLALAADGIAGIEALLARPLADAPGLGLSERVQRDALRVITASYEYHGGFRLRTLSA
jgi:hypothetical protein